MAFYDHPKFGVTRRKWFGLAKKWGGDAAGGFSFGTHDPGTLSHVEKWYPEGPIRIQKVGVFMCSTSNNASGGCKSFRFLTRGASASVIATMKNASCTVNEGTLCASKAEAALTVRQCKAGEYITIQSIEPTTRSATASEVKSTTSGAAAFFIDYIPTFDNDSHWTNS